MPENSQEIRLTPAARLLAFADYLAAVPQGDTETVERVLEMAETDEVLEGWIVEAGNEDGSKN